MTLPKPLTFAQRAARALHRPGKYVDRLELFGHPESLVDWQTRAVLVVLKRHLSASAAVRRLGLLWPTEKAYRYLDRFGPGPSNYEPKRDL